MFPKALWKSNMKTFYPRIDVPRMYESRILMNSLKCTVGSFFMFVVLSEISFFEREKYRERDYIEYLKMFKPEEDDDDDIYEKYYYRCNVPIPDPED